MRITAGIPVLGRVWILFLAAVIAGLLTSAAPGGGGEGGEDPATRPATQPPDARFAPYAPNADHLWNRLHQALFVREAVDGSRRIHSTDPLLYRGGRFLLEGEPHRRAIALLDQFVAGPDERLIDDPLKRLFFQRDLWGAFDYAAWYPDDWVFQSKYEAAAIALRNRLAKAIGRLALGDRELAALPDNYALAVKSKQYAADHDAEHPERPFLPADLFDRNGPWVRFHDTAGAGPMTQRHFEGAGGRAMHIVFLRLPGGRAATERYLKELTRDSVQQFPSGTMVAMVRRALAPERSAKVRVTPVTELVQIRVYRRIPKDPKANFHGDFGEQDVYEFVLDRAKLFAGEHGLRSVGPDERAEPFSRSEGDDPFEERGPLRHRTEEPKEPQMKSCIQCHQAPGVYSVTSMERGLREAGSELFRTYAWDVEMKGTVQRKVRQYNWGLLQGKLEAR
jgi:hypothetical protein